ncbi:hypothetical protein [Rathayibacter rathayi]|uniref:hypothetical protein n=1 Tax=Rathayibacter rathayi TaxID=33887 RepID=UPI000CE771DA|nr:hypothetical protein [Rathayibacter rathayi]PPH29276.1 hypothetical protein C5C28_14960 [Rathayibacter rathayi]
MRRFVITLATATVIPVCLALIGNAGGPFLCAFVSTAFVMFGIYDLVRKLRARTPLRQTLLVLSAGLLTGAFVTMSTQLGAGLYLGFLFGQALTVGLVLWLVRATSSTTSAAQP